MPGNPSSATPLTTDAVSRHDTTTVDDRRKWAVLASVGMGVFLATIDGTIVSVALPTLVEQLQTDLPTVQWITLAYLLVVTVLLLGMGRLGDMVGKKRPYMIGMVLFGASSALCGLAPNVGVLIAFRVVQAVGAAAMQALGTAIVTEAFPPTERGRALGISGLLVSAGILTGPVLGGVLIDSVGWRAIFFVNVPIAFFGIFLINHFVPAGGRRLGQRFDIPGALTLGIGLAALMLALTFGQTWGWLDGKTLALMAVSAVFIALFLAVELRITQPMVDLTLFRNPQFAVSLTMAVLVFIALSSRNIMPFFIENAQGHTPTEVGLILAVWPLMTALIAPGAGWLSDRIGSMKISLLGLLVSLAGYLLMAFLLRLELTPPLLALLIAPTGAGVGLFQSPNNSAVMGSVPRERLGLASGFLALTRNMGQLVGFAVVMALWASRVDAHLDTPLAGDIASASPAAIVAGTQETSLILAVLMGVAVVLGVAAVEIERRRRSGG